MKSVTVPAGMVAKIGTIMNVNGENFMISGIYPTKSAKKFDVFGFACEQSEVKDRKQYIEEQKREFSKPFEEGYFRFAGGRKIGQFTISK